MDCCSLPPRFVWPSLAAGAVGAAAAFATRNVADHRRCRNPVRAGRLVRRRPRLRGRHGRRHSGGCSITGSAPGSRRRRIGARRLLDDPDRGLARRRHLRDQSCRASIGTPRAAKEFDLLVPLLFGAVVFYLWEVAVRGFGVSPVLLPSPSAAAAKFITSLPTLGADFVQTFMRGVLVGYVIGCGAGLLVAILAHRYAFLGRGLLPLGNFFSALPLVGIAPIMVMWFGFDWPSKAAVVALVTFFPMLVNTVAGLAAAGMSERDLMRSYAAGYWHTLVKLQSARRAALHLQCTEDQLDAGSDRRDRRGVLRHADRGMGFRISIEVGRMALDMVWAEIALAAIAGIGLLRTCRAHRARDNLLASVVSHIGDAVRRLGGVMNEDHMLALAAGAGAWSCRFRPHRRRSR